MKHALTELGNRIGRFHTKSLPAHQGCDEFVRQCTLALTAGGEGSRLRHVTDPHGVHKSSYTLPNGETMIERTVRMYAACGFTEFVALVYYQADSIRRLLGDGSRYGVHMSYSADPDRPVGRGGALKHALESGVLDERRSLIVHNPDDQLIGDTRAILTALINEHLHHRDQGGLADVVVVEGTHYQYSGLTVADDCVRGMETYPFIPIPTHAGITFFSPGIYPYIRKLFSLDRKTDFEGVLFPALIDEQRLFAMRIPLETWIPVNDDKGLKKLVENLTDL